jgi:hypothetical protein
MGSELFDLYGVWGASSSDVYAVGSNGAILHYDGNEWSTMTSGTSINLWCIWGTSSTDIYVGGENGTILHYDGTGWTSTTVAGSGRDIRALWGPP